MAKTTFVKLASTFDDINVEKEESLKNAAKELAIFYVGSGTQASAASTDIDKLLKNFSDSDKYQIMKYAFLRCI